MKLTRRHVLALLACVPAAATVGSGALYLRWWDRAPGDGLLALSAREYEVVQAVAEAWMPGGGEPGLSGRDANLGAFFDTVLSSAEPLDRKLLKLLCEALGDLTVPTHGATFEALDVATRSDVLGGWLASDDRYLRTVTQTLLLLLSDGWATHPDVAAYLQPWTGCGYHA